MKITFCAQHGYWGGLSNTGGSRTIILCAKTLRELGHDAHIVTFADNHTWIKHPKVLKKIPDDSDVCIACSVSDIKPMLSTMPKKAKPFWWCRLIESYQMPKDKIIKYASKITTLVNSECLKAWFERHGVKTTVVYQGVDIDSWHDNGTHQPQTLGFLVSRKKRKNFDLIKNILCSLGDSYKYVGYGAKHDLKAKHKSFIHKYFSEFYENPTHEQLLNIYNMADIWVSTSRKEGLHNPPLEAALCGCILVCNGAPLGGTADYCINDKTGYVFKQNIVEDAIMKIRMADRHTIEPCKELIKSKIGDRKTATQHLLEVLNGNADQRTV